MTRAVLSIGSNLGDRLARLQAVVDGLAGSVTAVSPVYETDAWGGVEQSPFLNAVLVAEASDTDAMGWLRRAQLLEEQNDRVREQHWGPRTLDVDVICCHETDQELDREVISDDPVLTLPHPFAAERAFVLVPWLAIDPEARLVVAGKSRRADELLAALGPGERSGVRITEWELH